ncbi:MAG: AMP-binding protein, partial [Acidobacteriota bacterium]|nr:AMP-binding protein [Acidobacteriota bacterium]
MKIAAPDLTPYRSLGEALRTSTSKWADHLALIEADRERENCRLSYRDFSQAARPIAAALQAAGFVSGDRASILMSNQSKWLIAAYAVFQSGGVLVPLDYKLGPSEHLALLAHAKAKVLIVEYPIWRALAKEIKPEDFRPETILVSEAPPEAELSGAQRWEDCRPDPAPEFVPRDRSDLACIVYSSGTGGRPKGCMLTHDNYLKQCESLMTWYPFWPGLRYLSILPTNHAIDFMVGFIGPFICGATVIHLRTLRPEFLKAAFPRYRINYVSVVPMVL